MNENVMYDSFSQVDCIKYTRLCTQILINCLFKLRDKYEIIDEQTIKFLPNEDSDLRDTNRNNKEEILSFKTDNYIKLI